MRCSSPMCLVVLKALSNAFLSFTCFFFVAFKAEAKENYDLLTHIQQKGLLKVCSEAGYMPFEMKDSKGNWTGYDYELMSHFAKYLNVKLEMMDIKWDGIIPTLLSKKCDMIASSMAVTQERKRTLNFTDPVFQDRFAFAALKNTAEGLTKVEDFDKKGIKISVKAGSSSDLYLRKTIKQAILVRFEADIDTMNALKNKRVNFAFFNKHYFEAVNKQFHQPVEVIPIEASEDIAVALTKSTESDSLRLKFNEFFKAWKQTNEYKALYKYYFEDLKWITELNKTK
jgi:polar amino acid transport system substrate-binding protein